MAIAFSGTCDEDSDDDDDDDDDVLKSSKRRFSSRAEALNTHTRKFNQTALNLIRC